MKSRGLFGSRGMKLAVRERDIDHCGNQQAIVKVHACGVCGTDINFVSQWPDDPMPLGHEIAAEVVEVGADVSNLAPGDRVIVEDCTMCGECEDCKSGHPEFCRNLLGLDGQPGMGDYLLVHSHGLVKFEGLDYVSASLTEPLAVSLTSVINAGIPLGGSVVVLGNGPLGLMSARLAKLRGAGFVAVTGHASTSKRSKARFAAAERLGVDLCIRIGEDDVEDAIKSRFPRGVDRVIVSSPPESLPDGLKVIRFGGIITFFGLHLGDRNVVPIDINDLVFRKISLIPTFAEPAINFPTSNRLLREGLVDPDAIITQTFGFNEAEKILSGIVDGSLPAVKAVMTPGA